MCLKQMDLMKVLGMKLGPAIKVSSGIQYLRQLFPETKLLPNCFAQILLS